MSLNHPNIPSSLSGKTAIVTGGSSGIGKAIAKELYKYGAKVAIADLCRKKASLTAKDIGGIGLKCDVTKETEIQTLVSTVKKGLAQLISLFRMLEYAKGKKIIPLPLRMRSGN